MAGRHQVLQVGLKGDRQASAPDQILSLLPGCRQVSQIHCTVAQASRRFESFLLLLLLGILLHNGYNIANCPLAHTGKG